MAQISAGSNNRNKEGKALPLSPVTGFDKTPKFNPQTCWVTEEPSSREAALNDEDGPHYETAC